MGAMKDVVIRLMNGGEDAVAACHEMMPSWIQAAERLPKPGTQAVVFSDHGVEVATFDVDDDGAFWETGRDDMDLQYVTGVTHWMPLPSCPVPP